MILLRQLEALGLSKPAVLTGGWSSRGYREYREFAPALCVDVASDSTEGYLHGIDIDPRAVQIAAAGLYLKAKSLAKDSRPRSVNLVTPVLQLGKLPEDDAAVWRWWRSWNARWAFPKH